MELRSWFRGLWRRCRPGRARRPSQIAVTFRGTIDAGTVEAMKRVIRRDGLA